MEPGVIVLILVANGVPLTSGLAVVGPMSSVESCMTQQHDGPFPCSSSSERPQSSMFATKPTRRSSLPAV